VGIQADVRGPQASVRLSDMTKGVLNCARSNGFTAGREASIAVSVSENLEVRKRIVPFFEPGIHGVFGTEFQPQVPRAIGGFGALSHDAGSDRVLDKKEIRAEFSSDRGVHSRHGDICGKEVSNRVRSWTVDRSLVRDAMSAMAFNVLGMKSCVVALVRNPTENHELLG